MALKMQLPNGKSQQKKYCSVYVYFPWSLLGLSQFKGKSSRSGRWLLAFWCKSSNLKHNTEISLQEQFYSLTTQKNVSSTTRLRRLYKQFLKFHSPYFVIFESSTHCFLRSLKRGRQSPHQQQLRLVWSAISVRGRNLWRCIRRYRRDKERALLLSHNVD